jgi:myo-inositol-1(or 4)-monophosphatase
MSEQLNWKRLSKHITRALLTAGEYLGKSFFEAATGRLKEPGELVSDADIRVNEILKTRLAGEINGASWYSEEEEQQPASGGRASVIHASRGTWPSMAGGYRWIIDPVDGTTNFIFGIPHFAISVALEENGALVAGFVYNPITKELFSTHPQVPALRNGRAIRPGRTERPEESLVIFGFSANKDQVLRYAADWPLLFGKVKKGLGALGPALNICQVAAGRIDAFIDFGVSMEGQAAAGLIASKAGATLANYDGSAYSHLTKGIICTNGRLKITPNEDILQTRSQ